MDVEVWGCRKVEVIEVGGKGELGMVVVLEGESEWELRVCKWR